MSFANPREWRGKLAGWSRVWRTIPSYQRWGRTFLSCSVLFIVLVAVRHVVLSHPYQPVFVDISETTVGVAGALACGFAAARSKMPIRGLWALTAAYFALLVTADFHDFLVDIHFTGAVLDFLESLGWCTYVPLALLIFFPTTEEDSLKWKWLPLIDFVQLAVVIALAYFRLIYLHHVDVGRGWTEVGRAEIVRNMLLSVGLLLRALVEPSPRARAVYRIVAGGFAAVAVLQGGTPWHVGMVLRPAALLTIGICGAYWSDRTGDGNLRGRQSNQLRFALSVFSAVTVIVVLLLAYNPPARYRGIIYVASAVSVVLFIFRRGVEDHVRYSAVNELRKSERDYRLLFEDAIIPIVIFEPFTERVLQANPAACELYEMDRKDFVGSDFKNFTKDVVRGQEQIADLLRAGVCPRFETVHRTRSGREIDVLVSSSVIQYRGYPAVLSFNRDITEVKTAGRALEASEDRYRDLVDHSEDLLCIHDLQGRLLSVNPHAARSLGYEVDEMLAIPMRAMIPAEYHGLFDAYLARIKVTRSDRGLMIVLTRSGERRTWAYSNTLRSEGVAEPVVRGMAHDVTERRRAELALEASEQRYRMLFEKTVAGVSITGIDGRVIDCNDAWAKMFGFGDGAEGRGRNILDHHLSEAERAGLVAELMRDGVFCNREVQLQRRDGSRFWVLLGSLLVTDGESEPLIQTTLVDITERKLAEEALHRSEERMRLAQEAARIGTFERNFITGETRWTPQMESIYGLQPGDAPQSQAQFIELVHPEDRRHVSNLIAHSIELGEAGGEWRVIWPDGTEHWIEGRWRVFKDKGGKPIRAIGVDYDITERKRSEEALRTSEAFVRSVLDSTMAHVVVLNKAGDIVEINKSWVDFAEENAGAEPVSAIVGVNYLEVCRKATGAFSEEAARAFEGLQAVLDGSIGRFELEYPCHSPSQKRWFLMWAVPLQRGEGAVVSHIDITDRKRAEEELRQNEERFRVALKDSPITVFNQDRELRYTWIYNPRVHRQESVIGKTDEEILGASKSIGLSELKRKVLKSGSPLREEVVITLQGVKYVFDTTIEPLFDAEGNMVGITGAMIDIAKLRQLADSLEAAKERLINEKSYLESEIQAELGFETIIGQSTSLRGVLKQARIVASTDSTVLLLGETGTGKELVARSIHSLSARKDKSFIKLNCAAVPSGLLESELFGHEKGAFTGAVNQKAGRLELADKGTLFLDEIGELPTELQPKLLRVLQDREFERLGGVRTLKVDARIISATNRDLKKDVTGKMFREDLFYRLNVFPIQLPPLRERRSDIPVLVRHFVQKHALRMGKVIEPPPDKTLELLQNWNWPGNIRELENMIERMVILTKGTVLAEPPAELHAPQDFPDDNLSEMERDHIIRILRETKGVLSGTEGAANRLGIKRTTLQSMLKRFGIERREYQADASGMDLP